MGLLSWLVAAGRDTISQIVVVWLITTAIGFAKLHHVILGTVEVMAGYFAGQGITRFDIGHFLLWATLGNALGGTVFVAFVKYGHARPMRRREVRTQCRTRAAPILSSSQLSPARCACYDRVVRPIPDEFLSGMNDTPLSLLERLRSSPDDSSWQRLTDLYLPLVGGWLNEQKVSPADADDLTQEILLVIVRELSGFDHSGRKGAFRTWLRKITVHRLRGYWRSKQTSPDQAVGEILDQLEDPASDVSQLWDREHDEFIIRRLLELIEPEFSPSAWHAFAARPLMDLSTAETAAELGVNPNAVLIAKSRCPQGGYAKKRQA